MIQDMKARWFRRWAAATAAAALLVPSVAFAQEAGGTWEDAPAEPENVAPAANSQSAAPAQSAPAAQQQYDDRHPARSRTSPPSSSPTDTGATIPPTGESGFPTSAPSAPILPRTSPRDTGRWARTATTSGSVTSPSVGSCSTTAAGYGSTAWVGPAIPGRQYAPAWVEWRTPYAGYDYIGWAPMPPDYIWWNGVAVGVWFGLYTPWVFCPSGYFDHPGVGRYIVHDHHYASRSRPTRRATRPIPARALGGLSHSAAHIPAKAVPKTPARRRIPRRSAQLDPSGAVMALPPPGDHPGGRPSDGSGTRSMSSAGSWGSLRGNSRTIWAPVAAPGPCRGRARSPAAIRAHARCRVRAPSPCARRARWVRLHLPHGRSQPELSQRSVVWLQPELPKRAVIQLGSELSQRAVVQLGSELSQRAVVQLGSELSQRAVVQSGSSHRSAPSFSAPSAPTFRPSSSSHSSGGGGGGRRR